MFNLFLKQLGLFLFYAYCFSFSLLSTISFALVLSDGKLTYMIIILMGLVSVFYFIEKMGAIKFGKKPTKFFVTQVRTYTAKNIKGEDYEATDTRCIGYYDTLDKARYPILHCDLDEAGYYKYAVITEYSSGWYPYDPSNLEEWYSLTDEEKKQAKVMKIDKPDKWKNVFGWGIG